MTFGRPSPLPQLRVSSFFYEGSPLFAFRGDHRAEWMTRVLGSPNFVESRRGGGCLSGMFVMSMLFVDGNDDSLS